MKKTYSSSENVRVDAQTKACLKLWAAVVSLAVRDCCLQPFKNDQDKYIPQSESIKALGFIFNEDSNLDQILDWLNMDPNHFKKKLVDNMHSDEISGYLKNEIDDGQRRNFRYNYSWFKNFGGIK